MKIEKAIEVQNKLIGQTLYIWRAAKRDHLNQDQVFSLRDALIFGDNEYKKSPKWVHYYLSGYWAACSDSAWVNDLIAGRVYNGVLYSYWGDMPEEMKEILKKDMDAIPYHMYWKGSLDQYTC